VQLGKYCEAARSSANVIADYPLSSELALDQRSTLHPLFQALGNGISEFTFANLYLFRKAHHYRVSRLLDGLHVITGRDGDSETEGSSFFMLPFGLPSREILGDLFARFGGMKAATEAQSIELIRMGYRVEEDRDNFDYIYSRVELSTLPGPKFHKKKNQINKFRRSFQAEGKPLLEEYLPQALEVLDAWRATRDDPGDYEAAREALVRAEELQLCGGIYYVEGKPVAYTLGEENARGTSFVIHFEKAIHADRYGGIYQFINQVFASILPEKYDTINREQDLGDEGLRQAKESYNPTGFVKKFRVSGWRPEA
jgi:uncharacterized protein